MPIDSSIYNQLDTQAPARLSQLINQNLDPMASLQKVLSLKAAMTQGDLQQYQLKSAQLADQRAQMTFNMQQQLMKQFPDLVARLTNQPGQTMPYQNSSPLLNGGQVDSQPNVPDMSPQDYFGLVSKIPDGSPDKQAAYEVGFNKWPQYRPQVTNPAAANNADPSLALGNFGATMGVAGLPGSDSLMKLADLYKPQDYRAGSTMRDPATGKMTYIQNLPPGMSPNGMVPGFEDFLKRKAAAEVNPIEAGKYTFETGQPVPGASPSPAASYPQPPAPGGLAPTPQAQTPGLPPGMTPQGRAQAVATGAKEEFGKRGTELATMAAKVDSDGANAADMKVKLGEMQDLLQNFDPSKLAPLQQKLMEWRQVMPSWFGGLSQKDLVSVGSMQAFSKIATQLAANATRQLGAREAAQIFDKMAQANPNIAITPDGQAKIMGVMNAAADLQIAKSQAQLEWIQDPAHYGSTLGFEPAWSKQFQGQIADINKMVATIGGSAPNPDNAGQPKPTQAAPVSQSTGVPTATGANGMKLYLRNGQWVPK